MPTQTESATIKRATKREMIAQVYEYADNEGIKLNSDKEACELLSEVFTSEYGFHVAKGKNRNEVVVDYLKCLPSIITTVFYCHDIEKEALRDGWLKEGYTDKEYEIEMEMFWKRKAQVVCELMAGKLPRAEV